ncbi:hypothetical protein BRADI_2g17054v3, partial [Brachypodium distachyon]
MVRTRGTGRRRGFSTSSAPADLPPCDEPTEEAAPPHRTRSEIRRPSPPTTTHRRGPGPPATRKILNEDWETVIHKKWPRIIEEEWEEFKEKEKDPNFKAIQEWYAALRAKRKFNHRLGSRGIEGKKPVWEKEDTELAARGIVPPVPTMLRHDRSTTFVRSTMTKEQWAGLKPIRDDQKVLIDKGAEFESEGSHDELRAQWDSPLSYALGRNEHGGHIRTLGTGALRHKVFPQEKEAWSRKRKAEKHEEIIEVVKRAAREEFFACLKKARDSGQTMEEFVATYDGNRGATPRPPTPHDHQSTPNPSPPSYKSSAGSGTELPSDPDGPSDDIPKSIKCRILMPSTGNPLGARGLLMPRMTVVHNTPMAPDHVRVQVDSVLPEFDKTPAPYPPEEESMTLGQCRGTYIQWPR